MFRFLSENIFRIENMHLCAQTPDTHMHMKHKMYPDFRRRYAPDMRISIIQIFERDPFIVHIRTI